MEMMPPKPKAREITVKFDKPDDSKPTEMKMKITAGYWQYYFRDKDTLKQLSAIQQCYTMQNEQEITIPIPPELRDNAKAVLYLARIR